MIVLVILLRVHVTICFLEIVGKGTSVIKLFVLHSLFVKISRVCICRFYFLGRQVCLQSSRFYFELILLLLIVCPQTI
jgi:hypothetical protein